MRAFRWNYNIGRAPWGFALNAEIWNGRVAMVSFFWVLIQEAVTGKGTVIALLEGGSPVPAAVAGVFFVGLFALVGIIASSKNDDFFAPEPIIKELKEL